MHCKKTWLKHFSQYLHLKGFSPVCIRSCIVKLPELLNTLSNLNPPLNPAFSNDPYISRALSMYKYLFAKVEQHGEWARGRESERAMRESEAARGREGDARERESERAMQVSERPRWWEGDAREREGDARGRDSEITRMALIAHHI